MGHAALHRDTHLRHITELDRIVWLGIDRLAQVLADFICVNVDGGRKLDVGNVIPAQIDMHQTRYKCVIGGIAVVMYSLNK